MVDFPETPLEVTDENFELFIARYPLVLLDFWAEWCGPCKPIATIVESLAREYKGKIVFGKLNADENLKTATRFGIYALPNLLVLRNGRPVDQIVGAVPRARIESLLRKHLEKV